MKKIAKYIHILSANELKFQGPLVQFFNDPENGFSPSDHVFITPHRSVYDSLCSFSNVVLDTSCDHLINKYADSCDWIIHQGVINKKGMLLTKRRYLKKTVFRTWGGSHQRYHRERFQLLINFYHSFLDCLYFLYNNLTLGHCAAIGIANLVDELDLRKWLKKTPLFILPLGSGYSSIIMDVKSVPVHHGKTINVLVGHQGTQSENHLSIINELRRFEKEDISIYVPLSYGSQQYIDDLVREIDHLGFVNVNVVNSFMPLEEYIQFLNTMDVAILDCPSSMALGNISILLTLGKKLFLNKNGIIKETFDYLGIPCYTTDMLQTMSFSDFSASIVYPEGVGKELMVHDQEYSKEKWQDLFRYLDGRTE